MESTDIRLSAEIGCPACGRRFVAIWAPGNRDGAAQQCACGHRFTAAWPGWKFQPERVTVADTSP
jgi:hypothetical protein